MHTLIKITLIGISAAFMACNTSPSIQKPVDICAKAPSTKISPEVAQSAIKLYEQYFENPDGIKVVNPKIKYFTLPPCQMTEITRDWGPDPSIVGHMAIMKDTIKLVWEVNARKLKGAKSLFQSGPGYYDMVNSCPNNCQ